MFSKENIMDMPYVVSTLKLVQNTNQTYLDTKFYDILDILISKGWKIYGNTGQVHVFAFSDGRVVLNTAENLVLGFHGIQHGQHERPIRNKNLLTHLDRGGQSLVGTGKLFRITPKGIIGREDEVLTLGEFELVNALLKESCTDFWALGVKEDS
jgi:hypothetical protein